METKAAETRNTETVTVPRAKYELLQAQSERISALEKQVELLTEALRLSRHKRFGAASERASEEVMDQLSLLFNEAEVYADKAAEADSGSVAVAAHKRRKKNEYTLDHLPEDVPVEVVEHRLRLEDLVCPECGSTMAEIGKEVRRKVKLEPAKLTVVEDWYYSYACRRCEQEGIKTPVVKAAGEPNFIPGSFATPEAVAHIATQKFVMGSPLYRQEQELNRQGVPLKRQTMSNWLVWASEHLLTPVYDQLHKELRTRDVLHADETTLQVLREPGKTPQSKSYMWLYRTSGDTDRPIVLYEYQPDRKGERPKEFLTGFRGYLHTDGYSGYHDLPEDITVVGCWAHARRNFDEAMKSLPKGKQSGSSAATGLAYFTKLFREEEKLVELPPEKRYEQRLELEKPVLDALYAWAETRQAAPKSSLGKALNYLKDQQPYLMAYLKDGRLELSNNRAERSIKPFVIDRKNFLFANTPSGARSSAVIFSLIETAKENGLDPYRYLSWLMSCAAGTDLSQPDYVRFLLPWNAPSKCRAGKAHK